MAQGIPLVASNFDLWKAIIEKVDCGICIDPSSPNGISEAIHLSVSDKDKAKQMGENGRAAVLETFNWAPEEKKLIQIYQEL